MREYHLHVYFSIDQLELAETVRANLMRVLPELTYVGELIPYPVGPHPLPMFELHLPAGEVELALPVMEAVRQGLSVLIHPVLDDHLRAHTVEARWLGPELSLDVNFLRRAGMMRVKLTPPN